MARRNESGSISEEYKYALRDLTFNSKPIINNLTLFAQEHLNAASLISRVLIDHLLSSHPDIKLPALYLIDSICKNIGEPYITNFITLLPGVFPVAYRQLRDEHTRRDFIRTLETWWNIFPSDMIRDLQHKTLAVHPVAGMRRSSVEPNEMKEFVSPIDAILPPSARRGPQAPPQHTIQNPPAMHYPQPPHTTYPANPYPIPPQIIRLLQDLRSSMCVPAELYNEQRVADIMYHLEYACSGFDPGLFVAADERARLVDKRPLIDFINSIIGVTANSTNNSNIKPVKIKSPILVPSSHTHRHKQAPKQQIPTAQSQQSLPDVSPLLASLTSALSIDLSSLIAPKSSNISSYLIKPVYEEIIKNQPSAYKAIYDDLPKQCTICAIRFPDTSEGQKKLESHLDEHFRRNIRSKDKAKKVLARLWSPTEQDWIKNVEVKEIDRPAALFGIDQNIETPQEHKKAEVKIPAGSDMTEKFCGTCQEKIEICWDDETDEWIFKDAVKDSQGQIIHFSCANKL